MEKWLIVSNCQTFGFANSLKMQTQMASIEAADIWQFRNKIEVYINRYHEFDRIVIAPEIRGIPSNGLEMAAKVETIPPIRFPAYHPDLCYVWADGESVKTPLDAYNSIIALAAYDAGVSVNDAVSFYNTKTYERAGYFDLWATSLQRIKSEFEPYGLNLDDLIIRWSRGRTFMYSINHPKIECIFDLASLFLKNLGIEPEIKSKFLPMDNLINGGCFPVYTEIGEYYGAYGDYKFKCCGEYKWLTLSQFVKESYAVYDHYGRDRMKVESEFQSRYNAIRTIF